MAEVNKAKIGGESFDIVPLPALAVSPSVVVAQKNAAISFSVADSVFGSSLAYQWQISTNGGGTWGNSATTGATTATISVAASTARNGYMWRCVVTYNGKSEISAPGKLIVLS